MKMGDFVGEITNEWEKHNGWLEFADQPPRPLGIIVNRLLSLDGRTIWVVLKSDGTTGSFPSSSLKVIDEGR